MKTSGGGASAAKAHKKREDVLVAKGEATEKDKTLNAKPGALHAVHANLQAFIHASPNSRVGRTAAYAQALVGLEDATADTVAAKAALELAATALQARATPRSSRRARAAGARHDARPDPRPGRARGEEDRLEAS
jgi:hypothetical protein